MENRLQHLLLTVAACVLSCSSPMLYAQSSESGMSGDVRSINREFFELGVNAGVLNIEDFGSEYSLGANLLFHATENFFLQFNYLQADTGLSSFEESQGKLFDDQDRTFSHFDLLVGYRLFQAEFFPREGVANISSLYLVGGVGDTDFGGEAAFTYTFGAGYEIGISRSFILRFDYRHYMYRSNLLGKDKETHNGGFMVGINYLL